jgi:hypothetical protein
MKRAAIVLGIATIASAARITTSFAASGERVEPPLCAHCVHAYGAPAPEIGASALGALMVGGIALYVLKRRPRVSE